MEETGRLGVEEMGSRGGTGRFRGEMGSRGGNG